MRTVLLGIAAVGIAVLALVLSQRKPVSPIATAQPSVPVPAATPTPRAPTPVVAAPATKPLAVPPVEKVTEKSATQKKGYEPTSEQTHSLEEAKKAEEDWDKERRSFLEMDLKLSETEMSKWEALRKQAEVAEQGLLDKRVQSAEEEERVREALTQNREIYEQNLRAMLGSRRWQSFQAFYEKRWKGGRASLSLPLK